MENKTVIRQLSGLVVINHAFCTEGPVVESMVRIQRRFNVDFQHQKLGSLSIACNIKLEVFLYSVF